MRGVCVLRMCVCVDCGWMCGGGEWMCVDVCVSVCGCGCGVCVSVYVDMTRRCVYVDVDFRCV